MEVPELEGENSPFHLLKLVFSHMCPFVPSVPRYDFIEIRDGDSESADLLGKHCGNIAPPTIISSGSVLYIKFTSDYARQGAGFSLRYEIFKTGQCGHGGEKMGLRPLCLATGRCVRELRNSYVLIDGAQWVDTGGKGSNFIQPK